MTSARPDRLPVRYSNALLMETEPVFAYEFEGRRYDTGRPLGLLTASIELALRRADIGPGLREYLRTLPLED